MIRILGDSGLRRLVSKCWVFLYLLCVPFTVSAQEMLLESPGMAVSQGASPLLVQKPKLQLLSPDEIADLYQNIDPIASEDLMEPKEFLVTPVAPEEDITSAALPPKQQSEVFPEASAVPSVESMELQGDLVEEEREEFPLGSKLDATAEAVLGEETGAQMSEADAVEQIQFDLTVLRPHPSIMLLPSEVRVFNSAISKYLQERFSPAKPDVVAEKVQEIPKRETPHYPLVTLDSMMYRGAADWVAWVNGSRYTAQDMAVLPGLEIVSAAREQVTIKMKWVPGQKVTSGEVLGETGENLTHHRISFSQAPEISEGMQHRIQRAEGEGNHYLLTLSPNQAVITQDMTIHEGRVATARIREIYQESQRLQAYLQEQNSEGESQLSAGNITGVSNQDQEDLQKLLQLYRESQ